VDVGDRACRDRRAPNADAFRTRPSPEAFLGGFGSLRRRCGSRANETPRPMGGGSRIRSGPAARGMTGAASGSVPLEASRPSRLSITSQSASLEEVPRSGVIPEHWPRRVLLRPAWCCRCLHRVRQRRQRWFDGRLALGRTGRRVGSVRWASEDEVDGALHGLVEACTAQLVIFDGVQFVACPGGGRLG
jgi:hypothetical protein